MPKTLILLAKSAIAARPRAEMEALAATVAARLDRVDVVHAFSEQGAPSLRERLTDLARAGVPEIGILPVMLPMEPGFPAWITRAVHRWKAGHDGPLPEVRISAAPLGDAAPIADLLADLAAHPGEDIVPKPVALPDRSAIPHQGRRVLVCMGGPCNDAASGSLWQHLRAEQDRLKLRDTGVGMMSCKTSCLGPCNLAPVVQVWPEGTTYCGVDEAALNRIIAGHIQGGTPVEGLAYPSSRAKVPLRGPAGDPPKNRPQGRSDLPGTG